MSFLDATGLGTFWNKLKSTFQGPVSEVYKDALAPVNVMPNSTFSRTGGYPATQTFETLTPGATSETGGDKPFCQYWMIRAYNGAFSNVTVTRGNGVTITATPTAIYDTSEPLFLFIVNRTVLPGNNKTFTIGCKFSNMTGSVCNVVSTLHGGTAVTIYGNIYEDEEVRVMSANNIDSVRIGSVRFDPDKLNVEGSIQINGGFIYEGEFKKPPFLTSLDTKTMSQFLLRDYSNRPRYNIGHQSADETKYPPGRYRLFRLGYGKYKYSSGSSMYMSFIIMKTYTNYREVYYKVDLAFLMGNNNYSQAGKYLSIKYFKTATSYTETIASAQITYDSDGYFYFCVTNTHPWGGDLIIVPDLMSYNPIIYDIDLVYDEVPNTTDTVLITQNIVEGF